MSAASPDAKLLAACARFHELAEAIDKHDSGALVDDPVFGKMVSDQHRVIAKLASFKPRTIEGRQARARVACESLSFIEPSSGSIEALAFETLREIAGVPGD